MYPEKTFTSGRLRLLVNPLRKISSAFGDVPRKNVPAGGPSALGQSFSKNLSSDLLRYPEKVQLQTAFGFGSIPYEKSHQPSEMCPEKTLRPDGLRLLVNSLQKVSPASGNVPRKDVPARQPPAAFSHRPRGSPSGPLRWPEKEQLQTAFGFWSILFEKSLQRPAAITRKSTAPDSLRLWIYTEQKVSLAFGNIPQPFATGCRL